MSRVTPFRFIHCADLHLDSPFEGIAARSPAIASTLRDATFAAFDNIVRLALEQRVDFVVISGDVYDGEERSLRAQWRFNEALRELVGHDIRCFVVHGNHDPLSTWEAGLDLPPGVARFGGSSVTSAIAHRGDDVLAHVYGISFPRRDVRSNLAAQFQRGPDAPFAIAALHCNVGGDPSHDDYAPCSLDDLARGGMDYWALGHIHTRKTLGDSHPLAVYPGNPQGRNVRESGPRGCYLVEVNDIGAVSPAFIETDVVRWSSGEVGIERIASGEALLAAVQDRMEEARAQADGRGSVLRLSLSGRGEVHGAFRAEELVEEARRWGEDEAGRRDFVWVESLRDASRPTIDIDRRRQVKDFVGEFLGASQAIRDEPDVRHALGEAIADRSEGAIIKQYLERLGDDELREAVDRAELLGLDLLLEDMD